VVARRRLGPQRAHDLDVLVGASTALTERHAQRVELLLEPPDTDSEQDPALAQAVERGDLLGERDRVALRKDDDRGPEPDRRGLRPDPRQPDQRIGDRQVVARRHPATRIVGILRLVPGGYDGVLHRPDRLEPAVLGDARMVERDIGLAERPHVGEHHSELHGRAA